jgi:uncharacterized surface protein with fasciclin (FAS1) repeats
MLKSVLLGSALAIGISSAASAANIVDTAASAGQFQTLLAAAQAAGLADTLANGGPFTVFAPTDEAFAALPEGTVEGLLLPENQDQLAAILTYHVVDGAVMSGEIADGASEVPTLNTAAGPLAVEKGGYGVTVDGASVVQADIEADNGVIHVIDSVLMPN